MALYKEIRQEDGVTTKYYLCNPRSIVKIRSRFCHMLMNQPEQTRRIACWYNRTKEALRMKQIMIRI